MLYFAYGSNINRDQMRQRVPDAKPLGKFLLMNARLVFRMVADIVEEEGAFVPGVLWEISERGLRDLDDYEGVSSGRYRRKVLTLPGLPGGAEQVIVYVMNSKGIYPPSQAYADRIKRGYRSFGLSVGVLDQAIEYSFEKRNPSHVERKRMRRNGHRDVCERPTIKVAETVAAQKAGKRKGKRKEPQTYRASGKPQRRANLSDWLDDRRNGGHHY